MCVFIVLIRVSPLWVISFCYVLYRISIHSKACLEECFFVCCPHSLTMRDILHWLSLQGCHVRLKPEDSKGELINYLSSSHCISHLMNERHGKTRRLETGELIPAQIL